MRIKVLKKGGRNYSVLKMDGNWRRIEGQKHWILRITHNGSRCHRSGDEEQSAKLIVLESPREDRNAQKKFIKSPLVFHEIGNEDNIHLAFKSGRFFLKALVIDWETISTTGHCPDYVTLVLDEGITQGRPPTHEWFPKEVGRLERLAEAPRNEGNGILPRSRSVRFTADRAQVINELITLYLDRIAFKMALMVK